MRTLIAMSVEEVPGFAGYYPDPANPGSYIVRSTYPGIDLEAARAAIIKHDPSAPESFRTAPLSQEIVGISRLDELYQEAQSLVISEIPPEHWPEWQFEFSDLDEVHNQVLIGYSNEEARAWAQELIHERIGAQPGVIVAFPTEPAELD